MEPVTHESRDIIFEEGRPFSQSEIWEYQREYYHTQTINAWSKKIPFYITSNPYIANSYAHILIRFIQDCLNKNSLDPAVPFYVVELGAGSGTFSFHLLRRLSELRRSLSIELNLVYVMTDLVQENIDFWMSHENFQPFISSGQLDFARFDAESSQEISLLLSKKILDGRGDAAARNPFVFIANYCFDSLKHDVFRVSDERIEEGLCKLTTVASNINEAGRVIRLDGLDISFSFRETQLPYYYFETLNQLLLYYRSTANNQYISFPVGPLICIRNLQEIAGNKLLLISSDKGYSKHLDIYQKIAPEVVFHDNCFSVSVNFDAIGQYFRLTGGDSFNQFTEQSLTTCAFVSGFKFAEMHETSLALETSLNAFGHATINNLFLNYHFTANLVNIETILPFLEAIRWDAGAFNSCRDVIIAQIRNGYARKTDIDDLIEKMPVIEANFYLLPNTIDTFFDIGVFFQETMHYESALEYFQKSLQKFGEKDITRYNMGLCYYFLNQSSEAINQFSMALQQNPNYIMARGWIAQIEMENQKETAVSPGQTVQG